MWSNFKVDICILNTILMLANFGPGIRSRVSGVGPGFYSFPLLSSVFYENQYLSAGKEDSSSRKNDIPCIFLL